MIFKLLQWSYALKKNLVTLIALIFSFSTFGQSLEIAKTLYPDNQEEIQFTKSFFDALELHKTRDPFLEGKGPSMHGFSLDKMCFAWMINITEVGVDLVIFNWKGQKLDSFVEYAELTQLFGSPVYLMKNVIKEKIATQGENSDLLVNFSFVYGKDHMAAIHERKYPSQPIPDEIRNFKPHPNYMDANHPLRQNLGVSTMSLLSPSFKLLQDSYGGGMSEEEMRRMLQPAGGFINSFLGMIIHEMFHVEEGDSHAIGTGVERKSDEDRGKIIEDLETDSRAVELISTYAKIIFSIADQMDGPVTGIGLSQLAQLFVVIKELKNNYPDIWKFIWNYEYTEGFAEYASAYSMVGVKFVTLEDEVKHQKGDLWNNFVYRTGSLGGLFMIEKTKSIDFSSDQDKNSNIWELVIEKFKISSSNEPIESIIEKYRDYEFDTELEIANLKEYLEGTIFQINESE